MRFLYQTCPKVYFGKGCVPENAKEFAKYGKMALIVTGRNSARMSGALGDVIEALRSQGAAYEVFDGIEPNPSLDAVKAGGQYAAKIGAQFVIGIGGGSPLDAAKAVAVLARNDIPPVRLYDNVFKDDPLPTILIPTTAGTGSEVTCVSILTRKDTATKQSFGNETMYARAAFLDASYTLSLPREVTVDTAVDALTHAMESYTSRKSSEMSEIFAEKAIAEFGLCKDKLSRFELGYEDRERLLYMSMLAGIAIAHTGTTLVHAMGYSLTYFKGLSHGRANGLLMKEYLRFNADAAGVRIGRMTGLLGLSGIEGFNAMMDGLMRPDTVLSDGEIDSYTEITMQKRNVSCNIRPVEAGDVRAIFKNVFK